MNAKANWARLGPATAILVGGAVLAVGSQFQWLTSPSFSGWIGYAPLTGATNPPNSVGAFESHVQRIEYIHLDHPLTVLAGLILVSTGTFLIARPAPTKALKLLVLIVSSLAALLLCYRIFNVWEVVRQPFWHTSLMETMGIGLWLAVIGASLALTGAVIIKLRQPARESSRHPADS